MSFRINIKNTIKVGIFLACKKIENPELSTIQNKKSPIILSF